MYKMELNVLFFQSQTFTLNLLGKWLELLLICLSHWVRKSETWKVLITTLYAPSWIVFAQLKSCQYLRNKSMSEPSAATSTMPPWLTSNIQRLAMNLFLSLWSEKCFFLLHHFVIVIFATKKCDLWHH